MKSRAEVITTTQEKLAHLETEFTKLTGLFNDKSEELADTRECLHKTNVMLQNTKTKLKNMIEDRDGLQFLVENYRKTEEHLYDNATTLLGVVEKTSFDNDRLHNKLERKQVVEKHNAQHKDVFRRHCTASIKAMEANLENYRYEQTQKSKDLVEWIGNYVHISCSL